MSQFIFLLRNEKIDFSTFAPEQFQELLKAFDDWNATMMSGKNLLASANLKDGTGNTLRLQAGNLQTDGPYCETKEAVAGFFIVEAVNLEAALEFAKGCPFLPLGGSVEVRGAQLEIEDYYRKAEPQAAATARACE